MGFVRFTKRLISIAVVPSIVFWALVTVFSPVKVERDWMELVAKLPTKSAFVMVTEESRLDDILQLSHPDSQQHTILKRVQTQGSHICKVTGNL
ncbi:hypothetical protein ROZALSC1DRAFT_27051 [Rozella allomycis CSF55]|uniref:Uncharacterized protein n=1 Tax=Rozella allomycis (strain CSF55) TaxID=988480 RepID=A0A075AWN2_ROZAC|nr:hypothetical protein O9G_002960 [Rozella allomycis CSF55]RKP21565.1 hypothetical protein ROZALSC1DRAFT_27051 [Rozella allomycis CSF55]|eukprot:EPZ34642.1 hypothetical protein O9G_002960 [Rozella allomycis CSF55]